MEILDLCGWPAPETSANLEKHFDCGRWLRSKMQVLFVDPGVHPLRLFSNVWGIHLHFDVIFASPA